MNVEQIKEWIAAGECEAVESAWMDAIEGPHTPEAVGEVLTALVEAGQAETAETLGWALLADQADRRPAEEVLELARAALLAVPDGGEIRSQTIELYRQVHGAHEHLDDLFQASGIGGGQAPRRAIRTLDTCLALRSRTHLVNRFDGRVICIERYDPALRQFEFTDARGAKEGLEPKLLADEFDVVDERDFRALRLERPEALARMFQDDPARVLIGLCIAHGGRIDANQIKAEVVPTYVPKDKWSSWWGRARTAAKRCEKLSLEGRHPISVVYHPRGRSLEDELSGQLASVRTPLGYLEVLRTYVREAGVRRQEADGNFARRIMEALAEQTRSLHEKRPADALAAVLAIDAGTRLGAPAPGGGHPSIGEVMEALPEPAKAVATLGDGSLWPAALAALKRRADAAEQLDALLYLAPAEQMDSVVAALGELGRTDAAAAVAARAMADPLSHLEACLWLWGVEELAAGDLPNRLEVLARLLKVLQELDSRWDVARDYRREVRQRVRSAFAARDYACFRRAVEEMDEPMAGVTRTRIERTDGLAVAVREKMLQLLRERFPALFVREKVEPWLDERVVWTTAAAMDRRQEELRVLMEEAIPANARRIGEAAQQGDISDNADWQTAIEERDMLQARVLKIRGELARARVLLAADVPQDSVGVGCSVRLTRLADGSQIELTFLGPWDSDPGSRVYAYTSQIARALMGKAPGQTAAIRIEGEEGEYRVEAVSASPLL
jgi:transcription elongation factor GreA